MQTAPAQVKPFSWSWSKLKNYRTCPKRHYEIDIMKHFHESSEALEWGNEVHKAMADYIAKGIDLSASTRRYREWPEVMIAMSKKGFDIRVEQKIAIASDFGACGFFAGEAWCRGVIDVLGIAPNKFSAFTIDWKTGGKVQPEFEQLALSAQMIFAHYPQVHTVEAVYVWLGHDTYTNRTYYRDKMAPTWNELWPTIQTMDEAWRTTTYPAKPSGLCVHYCPVTNCPHHGRGSR